MWFIITAKLLITYYNAGMGVAIRVDSKAKHGSVLDLIRLKNDIRSNHAAALLSLIQDKHPNLPIWKDVIDRKGRATPVATFDTLKIILTICPTVRNRAITTTDDQLIQLLDKSASKKPIMKKRFQICKNIPKNTFGPLSSMIKVSKIS